MSRARPQTAVVDLTLSDTDDDYALPIGATGVDKTLAVTSATVAGYDKRQLSDTASRCKDAATSSVSTSPSRSSVSTPVLSGNKVQSEVHLASPCFEGHNQAIRLKENVQALGRPDRKLSQSRSLSEDTDTLVLGERASVLRQQGKVTLKCSNEPRSESKHNKGPKSHGKPTEAAQENRGQLQLQTLNNSAGVRGSNSPSVLRKSLGNHSAVNSAAGPLVALETLNTPYQNGSGTNAEHKRWPSLNSVMKRAPLLSKHNAVPDQRLSQCKKEHTTSGASIEQSVSEQSQGRIKRTFAQFTNERHQFRTEEGHGFSGEPYLKHTEQHPCDANMETFSVKSPKSLQSLKRMSDGTRKESHREVSTLSSRQKQKSSTVLERLTKSFECRLANSEAEPQEAHQPVQRPRRAQPSINTNRNSSVLMPREKTSTGASCRHRRYTPYEPHCRSPRVVRFADDLSSSTPEPLSRCETKTSAKPFAKLSQDTQIRQRTKDGSISLSNETSRPYQTVRAREACERKSRVPHVDFSTAEMIIIFGAIIEVRKLDVTPACSLYRDQECIDCIGELIKLSLRGTSVAERSEVAIHARELEAPGLRRLHREFRDIKNFLEDAAIGLVTKYPTDLGINGATLHSGNVAGFRLSSQIQLRELGMDHAIRGRRSETAVNEDLKLALYDKLRPSTYWPTGGSSDVVSVAWHPNGDVFAAGCAAFTDSDNMQYNRCNNLLLGCVSRNRLKELPDHRLPRYQPATGPNSSAAMFNALDPWLYYSVSTVKFSLDGRRMYTAAYDKTVRIWDTTSLMSPGRLLRSLEHQGVVDTIATSDHDPRVIATGSKVFHGGVRLYRFNDDENCNHVLHGFSSKRAFNTRVPKELYPSCIQWGKHSSCKHLVIAGFTSDNANEDEKFSKDGDLCLFDSTAQKTIQVVRGAQNVFDCVWHPTLPKFAVGCTADSHANRGIQSYVRLYSDYSSNSHELECPALDMNEITWCTDEYYCTASCTDSNTYVWDLRMPACMMHVLPHGDPIQPLPSSGHSARERAARERADTGVRFAQWGHSTDRFYTGSSDGVVKAWNIKRATEDSLVRDVVQLEAGVMCGAFSADYSNLLLGDTAGTLKILSVQAGDDVDQDEPEEMHYEKAVEKDEEREDPYEKARAMLENNEIALDHSKGYPQAVQGPKYKGPWATDEYAEESRAMLEDEHLEYLQGLRTSWAGTRHVRLSFRQDMPTRGKSSRHPASRGRLPGRKTPSRAFTSSGTPFSDAEGDTFAERMQDLYLFDCGIFPTELRPEDIEKEKGGGD